MWRCPECTAEFFAPCVCSCGHDGRNEPEISAGSNPFDISLKILGGLLLIGFVWLNPKLLRITAFRTGTIVVVAVALVWIGERIWRWKRRWLRRVKRRP